MHGNSVYIDYTNHKGERKWRHIEPQDLMFTKTKEHDENQWILKAHDIDKDLPRSFAMVSIHEWRMTKPGDRELASEN